MGIRRSKFLKIWFARLTGPTARKGSWSVVDQAVVSGTRFTIGITLARCTDKSEYGIYVLAFTVLLFMNGIQSAIISGPMTILGAPKEGSDLRRYVSTLAVTQVFLGILLVMLSFLGIWCFSFMSTNLKLQYGFGAMAISIFFVQLQEFCRRVLFMKQMPERVLINDLFNSTILLGGLFFLLWLDAGVIKETGKQLSAQNVFFCMACAALVASIIGFYQIKEFLESRLKDIQKYLKESLSLGKWMLGSFFGDYLLAHVNKIIVGIFVGVTGAAILEAPRLILAPLHILIFGGGGCLDTSSCSEIRKTGWKGFSRLYCTGINNMGCYLYQLCAYYCHCTTILAADFLWRQI